jgi:hypothetical protein
MRIRKLYTEADHNIALQFRLLQNLSVKGLYTLILISKSVYFIPKRIGFQTTLVSTIKDDLPVREISLRQQTKGELHLLFQLKLDGFLVD